MEPNEIVEEAVVEPTPAEIEAAPEITEEVTPEIDEPTEEAPVAEEVA